MPGGRPRKPTALKVLHGTNRPDRANPSEPQPAAGAPKPPAWLKGRGRRHWREIAALLEDMRVLTVADRQALALLCDILAEYVELSGLVRRDGHTYRTANEAGQVLYRPRPEVAMAADAWRRSALMLQQFGLTPSSRAKVSARPADDVDPDEELLRGLGG